MAAATSSATAAAGTSSAESSVTATPAAASAPAARLALHFAVWDDDDAALEALLLAGKDLLEVEDAGGNTPLMLAYRMGRTKCARMLLAAGAFPKVRTREGFEAIQVAALTANPDLIREAVLAFLAETDAAFARRLTGLQAALARLPDFTMRLTWEFSSWIPLVSRLLPSDTYIISKRGTSLRIDSTLLAMNGLTWQRGSISLLLWGADMPKPGAMYVMDNEEKTVADARMAFTHPQDVHIQDWVRKLLTQKQKTTDFWSRDAIMVPVIKQSLFGSWMSGLSKLALGDGVTRGRVTDTRATPTAGAGAGATSPGGSPAEGGGDDTSADLTGSAATPKPAAGGGGGGAAAAATPFVHVDIPNQATEEAGMWGDCLVYEMKNLCVRDVAHSPLLPELKLKSWWRPEYSRQATEADVKAADDASKGIGAGAGAAGAGVATPAAPGAKSPTAADEDDAPEKALSPLLRALDAIRAGKINEKSSSSTVMAELEGMGYDDEGTGTKTTAAHTLSTVSFRDYFGFDRPPRAAPPATAAAPAAAGAGVEIAAAAATAAAVDRSEHCATGVIADFRPEALTTEDKTLDLKVLFSREFPLDVSEAGGTSHHLFALKGVAGTASKAPHGPPPRPWSQYIKGRG